MDLSANQKTFLLAITSFFIGMILMSLVPPIFNSPSQNIIHTTEAPEPIGPYSQAVRAGDLVFTSGQVGIDPKTGNMSVSVGEQTEQVMKNLKNVLSASGDDFSDVVSTRIYLVNISDFSEVNEIYARYMETSVPARSTVEVAALPKGALIEIEMVAYR